MRILIAVGGSKHSQIALRQAVCLAQIEAVSATILTVVKDESETAKAEEILQNAVRFLAPIIPPMQNLQTKVGIGTAEEQIVAEAASGNYDLLLIGERPQHKLLTRLLGPTALRILTQIPCPVLVAKGEPHLLEEILVCDSVYAQPNLSQRFAHHLSQLLMHANNVTVLHVMSQMAAAPGVPGQQLRADVDELIDAHSPEGKVLTQDVQLMSENNVDVEPMVRHGLVVEEILTEAKNGRYDLIVIGAHPHEGWQRFLLEDVTAQIVQQAHRPVLVIP